ncbi:MAG TPA: hypothetical protein VEB66_12195 [Opitutaceae bacterium]|nr:hypothetical protein [Opitutaceae bacterium]
MKKFWCLLLLACAAPARAADDAPLAPIAFWAGSTWRGQLPPPPQGGTAPVLETTFAWMENGKALRFDTVAVAGERRRPYVSGMYAWHPGRKSIVFWYADAAGALTEGAVAVEDGALSLDFTATSAAGVATAYRARITPEGVDAYWNEIFRRENEEWKSFVKVRYERVK